MIPEKNTFCSKWWILSPFMINFIKAYADCTGYTLKWYPRMRFRRIRVHKSPNFTGRSSSVVDKVASKLCWHIRRKLRTGYSDISTVLFCIIYEVGNFLYHVTLSVFQKKWILNFLHKKKSFIFCIKMNPSSLGKRRCQRIPEKILLAVSGRSSFQS